MFDNYAERSGSVVCTNFMTLLLQSGYAQIPYGIYWTSDTKEEKVGPNIEEKALRLDFYTRIRNEVVFMGWWSTDHKYICRAVLDYDMYF